MIRVLQGSATVMTVADLQMALFWRETCVGFLWQHHWSEEKIRGIITAITLGRRG